MYSPQVDFTGGSESGAAPARIVKAGTQPPTAAAIMAHAQRAAEQALAGPAMAARAMAMNNAMAAASSAYAPTSSNSLGVSSASCRVCFFVFFFFLHCDNEVCMRVRGRINVEYASCACVGVSMLRVYL